MRRRGQTGLLPGVVLPDRRPRAGDPGRAVGTPERGFPIVTP